MDLLGLTGVIKINFYIILLCRRGGRGHIFYNIVSIFTINNIQVEDKL